jgi:prepilin-type N-terminal cleavage/methylation domain-containing protein
VRRDRHRGMTLIELLVAAVIVVILLGVLLAVFVSSARGYRAADTAALVQQRAEIATTLLTYEIGLAGYRGILDDLTPNTFTAHRLVISGSGSELRTRYYEDRFLQGTGTTMLRDVTYRVGTPAGGVPSLLRVEGGVAQTALIGVTSLMVEALVRADGSRTNLPGTPPTTNPAVGLQVAVTLDDGYVARFIIAVSNVDLADPTQFSIQ